MKEINYINEKELKKILCFICIENNLTMDQTRLFSRAAYSFISKDKGLLNEIFLKKIKMNFHYFFDEYGKLSTEMLLNVLNKFHYDSSKLYDFITQ